ncbi:MAG: hypothetical protein V3W31_10075 [Thermodesulfobacteriota bacterium]
MGSFTDYWENEILDHIFNKGAYTAPTVYVALSTTTPLDDGTNVTEPAGGAYARVSTAAGDWNTAAGGLIDNANAITFPEATGSWGTITHFLLYDAASAGNAMAWGALTASKAIGSGDTARFAAGDLDVSLD